MRTRKGQRVDALDGWRALAVIIVIVFHLVTHSSVNSRMPQFVISSAHGDIGVYIFFVISGYVICDVLKREREAYGRISLIAFYLRRCFRILPALWCYLITIVILVHFGVIELPLRFVMRAAGFACNVSDCWWYVGHTWSLAYEEQFYLIFPLTFVLALRRPQYKRLYALAAAGLPFCVIMLYHFKHGQIAYYLFVCELLLFGILLSLFSNEIYKILIRIPSFLLLSLMCFSIVLIFVVGLSPDSAIRTGLLAIVIGPLIAFVLYSTSHFPSTLHNFFSSRPMCLVGRMSYGIYLWQQLANGNWTGMGPSFYGVGIVVTVGVAWISFSYLETPLNHVGASIAQRQIERALTARAAYSMAGGRGLDRV
jgi:peptidoglycan/LPS O-acetylase OafA/YrhL